ncbi:NDR1/HIN1-like protein [Mucisphaera calidilacus]|uniref:Late embryogenesis abundant protein LEA-2 subgroup domain-containing protein n=1 Tax=Mucisphaera calidilacus TaxID=2527982 RepID=A0A518BWK8_9BACT|nr:LEA type 2 family protein [Mucisphaera calidilacus]QDU71356.1 hypothetical protein Pan265_12050 [Mucisphaera calidilacus]
MTKRKDLWILMLPTVLALGGCFAQRPPIEVVSVALTDQSPSGHVIETILAVRNPWDKPVQIGPVDWTIEVNGTTFSDTDSPPVSLPADGVQTVTLRSALPATADKENIAYSGHGKLTFTPPGDFRVVLTESGFPLPKADFRFSGSLDANTTP